MYVESVEDCEAILERIGEHHAAYVDLAGAHFRARDYDAAEENLQRAVDLDYPLPGLVHNYRACIAAAAFDLDGVQEHLRRALREDPYHYVVAHNAETLRRWFVDGGPVKGLPLNLEARHEFQLFERTVQPALPGPLDDDFDEWLDLPEVESDEPNVRRHLNLV
jgi:tetratricopeptide (TPR) repeat protein